MVLLVCTSGLVMAQGKISSLAFGDYFYNVQRDASIQPSQASPSGAQSYQAFQFRRIYFTYDYTIDESFSTRFRLEADQNANASNGAIGLMVKDAFLKWSNIVQNNDIILGIQPTPGLEVPENFWGYRSLERMILDLRGLVSSRDIGIAMRGSILEGKRLNYSLLLGNGNGNKPENDKYKRIYLTLSSEVTNGILTALSVDYSPRRKTHAALGNSSVDNSLCTCEFFAGYTKPNSYRAGVEVFQQSIKNEYSVGTSLRSKDTYGISLFGVVTVSSMLEFVWRYDYFDPNNASSSRGDSRGYAIVGVDYKVRKNISLIPNIIIETFEKQRTGYNPKTAVTLRLTFFYSI